MKILVTGSSGLIGSVLVKSLTENGHLVGCLLRNKTTPGVPNWNIDEGFIDLGDFTDFDAVIHLAGDNIADGRWSASKKASILNSRVKGTKLLSEFLKKRDPKPKVFISGSAIGFYGDCGEQIVDEGSEQGRCFLSDVCKQWEEAAITAANAGIRVVNIRTGMVLGKSGGALSKMLFPFKIGLGGMIGSGKQYMSWIEIHDMVGAIEYILQDDSIYGPVNLVSPNPVTNYQFTKILGDVLNRPTLLPIASVIARILFGEMADELLLTSTRAVPKKLLATGYTFCHPQLNSALLSIMQGQ